MVAIGIADPNIIADTPLYAVFEKAGKHTYIAYNSSSKQITVTFRSIELHVNRWFALAQTAVFKFLDYIKD